VGGRHGHAALCREGLQQVPLGPSVCASQPHTRRIRPHNVAPYPGRGGGGETQRDQAVATRTGCTSPRAGWVRTGASGVVPTLNRRPILVDAAQPVSGLQVGY
jgi:hypothetical protein